MSVARRLVLPATNPETAETAGTLGCLRVDLAALASVAALALSLPSLAAPPAAQPLAAVTSDAVSDAPRPISPAGASRPIFPTSTGEVSGLISGLRHRFEALEVASQRLLFDLLGGDRSDIPTGSQPLLSPRSGYSSICQV